MKTADLVGLGIVALGLGAGAYIYTNRAPPSPGGQAPAYNPPPAYVVNNPARAAPTGTKAGNVIADVGNVVNVVGDIFSLGKQLFG